MSIRATKAITEKRECTSFPPLVIMMPGLFSVSYPYSLFSAVVTLLTDKEGPIHDFTWNPSSKEFAICYGFMPAKTTVFDQRCHPIIEFPAHPHNFISFNPQGRLVALAGFGNLQGKVDVYDRRLMDVQSGGLRRIGGMEAGNTTHFEWSPDGRLILTAILSPRLRVDNGVRLWHCTGSLLEVRSIDELYQVSNAGLVQLNHLG
jgi:translation initiation factor 2A